MDAQVYHSSDSLLCLRLDLFISVQICFCSNRDGERWYKLRVVLNKRMLNPKDSAQYSGIINDVVKDFTKKMRSLCQCSPTGDFVTNIANELYLFSLEGSLMVKTANAEC